MARTGSADDKKEISTEKLKQKISRHLDLNKMRIQILKDNQDAIREEFKLKTENIRSVDDYFLGMARQVLTLSATGYLGLLALPLKTVELLANVAQIKFVLLASIFISILLIVYFVRRKIVLRDKIDLIIKERISIYDALKENNTKCHEFCNDTLEILDEREPERAQPTEAQE